MASTQTQKGSRFEYTIRDKLTKKCGVKWERTPLSGAGRMKGDLYCLTKFYYYCIECKSFKDTVICENLLSAKSNNFYSWWSQCLAEAAAMEKKPALVFKKDRGQPLIAVIEYIKGLNSLRLSTSVGGSNVDVHIYLFDEWLRSKDVSELVTL